MVLHDDNSGFLFVLKDESTKYALKLVVNDKKSNFVGGLSTWKVHPTF